MNLKELNRNLRHCVEHPEDWFLFLKKMKIKIKWMDGCSRIFWSSITASYFQTLFKCKIKLSEKRPRQLFVFFPLIKQPPHSSGDPTEGSDPCVGNHCACRRLQLQQLQLQLWCIIRQQNKVWSFGGKQFELLAEALLLYWFRASDRRQQTTLHLMWPPNHPTTALTTTWINIS